MDSTRIRVRSQTNQIARFKLLGSKVGETKNAWNPTQSMCNTSSIVPYTPRHFVLKGMWQFIRDKFINVTAKIEQNNGGHSERMQSSSVFLVTFLNLGLLYCRIPFNCSSCV